MRVVYSQRHCERWLQIEMSKMKAMSAYLHHRDDNLLPVIDHHSSGGSYKRVRKAQTKTVLGKRVYELLLTLVCINLRYALASVMESGQDSNSRRCRSTSNSSTQQQTTNGSGAGHVYKQGICTKTFGEMHIPPDRATELLLLTW